MNPDTFRWQWNGSALFEDILQWCRGTFGYVGWWWEDVNFYFEREQDYALFLLRWK
jgi:GNAT superfamily N-acetyltransferase